MLALIVLSTPPDALPVDASPVIQEQRSVSRTSGIALPTITTKSQASKDFVATETVQIAQAITPANNGTGTVITTNGNQFDITGGKLSGDGGNLFHTFQQFGLSAGQIANFMTNPSIQNIIGSVSGGASYIDGLLRVSGSNANLYLVNPAGIVFGPNATLNLNGSFTATTATGMKFADKWFNALGNNEHAQLIGDPTSFLFGAASAGSIVNIGNLTVNAGEQITLIGGTVINTGTITAPGGNIHIAAVPAESAVRITQEGSLLSLKIEALPSDETLTVPTNFSPVDLPRLLTGADSRMDDLSISFNSDGSVELTTRNRDTHYLPWLPYPSETLLLGKLDASGATGGTIFLAADGSLKILNATLNVFGNDTGGTILGNAGIRIDIFNSSLNAFGVTGGNIIMRTSKEVVPVGNNTLLTPTGTITTAPAPFPNMVNINSSTLDVSGAVGGTIDVTSEVVKVDGSILNGSGDTGGMIRVTADALHQRVYISNSTLEAIGNVGGTIDVMSYGTTIDASTLSVSGGTGGTIRVIGMITEQSLEIFNAILDASGSIGGTVELIGSELHISNTNIDAAGRAGVVKIETRSILMDDELTSASILELPWVTFGNSYAKNAQGNFRGSTSTISADNIFFIPSIRTFITDDGGGGATLVNAVRLIPFVADEGGAAVIPFVADEGGVAVIPFIADEGGTAGSNIYIDQNSLVPSDINTQSSSPAIPGTDSNIRTSERQISQNRDSSGCTLITQKTSQGSIPCKEIERGENILKVRQSGKVFDPEQ